MLLCAAAAVLRVLCRFIAGLGLDERHRVALVKEAVIRNKHVGNFRCVWGGGWGGFQVG